MTDLSTKFAGLDLKNPIIAGSSGLTDNVGTIKEIEDAGAAAVVLKSIFEEEILMEAREAVAEKMQHHHLRESFDYIDHHLKGLRIDNYVKLISDTKKAVDIPVIASINCVSQYEWPYFVDRIQKAGADALELNLFALPSDTERNSLEIELFYFDVIEAVKKVADFPIILKISHYFTGLAQMIQKLSESGISGLVLFNRFYSPDFDMDNFKVIPTNVLSSPAELAISLRWISIMSGRTKCGLAASTGIHDGKAVLKQIAAGAAAVQTASALYKNGVNYISQMLKDMSAWMEEKGYSKLDDFRGKMSGKSSENPAALERIQFMKYFSGIQ